MSINLLPDEIAHDSYVDWLLDEVGAAGIDPKRVTIEITEYALLSDLDAVAARLGAYSPGWDRRSRSTTSAPAMRASLISAALPLDALKIDRGLICQDWHQRARPDRRQVDLRSCPRSRTEVVVEGVESTAQLVLLAEWGCDLYQGFLGAGALDESGARALRRRVPWANAA